MKDILLDTHILLWLTTDDVRLSDSTKKIILSRRCLVSTISLWEITIKFSNNKLKLDGGLIEFLKAIADLNFEYLNITDKDLMALNELPKFENHKDPFDRLLIAQAKANDLEVISHDDHFKMYDLKLL